MAAVERCAGDAGLHGERATHPGSCWHGVQACLSAGGSRLVLLYMCILPVVMQQHVVGHGVITGATEVCGWQVECLQNAALLVCRLSDGKWMSWWPFTGCPRQVMCESYRYCKCRCATQNFTLHVFFCVNILDHACLVASCLPYLGVCRWLAVPCCPLLLSCTPTCGVCKCTANMCILHIRRGCCEGAAPSQILISLPLRMLRFQGYFTMALAGVAMLVSDQLQAERVIQNSENLKCVWSDC